MVSLLRLLSFHTIFRFLAYRYSGRFLFSFGFLFVRSCRHLATLVLHCTTLQTSGFARFRTGLSLCVPLCAFAIISLVRTYHLSTVFLPLFFFLVSTVSLYGPPLSWAPHSLQDVASLFSALPFLGHLSALCRRISFVSYSATISRRFCHRLHLYQPAALTPSLRFLFLLFHCLLTQTGFCVHYLTSASAFAVSQIFARTRTRTIR